MTPNCKEQSIFWMVSIQRDLGRLEKWADRKLIMFEKSSYKDLHVAWNNFVHQYRLGV